MDEKYHFSDFIPIVGFTYFNRAGKILESMSEEEFHNSTIPGRAVLMFMYHMGASIAIPLLGIANLEKILQ